MRSLAAKIGDDYYYLNLTTPDLASTIFDRKLLDASLVRQRFPIENAKPLSSYLSLLKSEGYEHLTIRIQQENYQVRSSEIGALLGEPVVTMVKYIQTRGDFRNLRPIKELCQVRPYEAGDLPTLLDIASDSFGFTRFFRDDFFPDDLCRTFYRELTRSYCDNAPDNYMTVAVRDEKVIGFLGWRYWEEKIEDATIRCVGRGLGGVRLGYGGAYLSLLHRGIRNIVHYTDVAEQDAQDDNEGVLKLYKYLNMKKIASTCVFHHVLQ
jgi:hypothetical protein